MTERPSTPEQYAAMLHALVTRLLEVDQPLTEEQKVDARALLASAPARVKTAAAMLTRVIAHEGPSDEDKIRMGTLVLDTALPPTRVPRRPRFRF